MEYKLEIIMKDNHTVSIVGPIDNRLLCFSLLMEAQRILNNHHDKLVVDSKIHIPDSVPKDFK